ncbi:Galactose/methyl galactoside import ATP-binding protein MglA [Caprobacter fermentans]|uniref:Galactose/methyl galactoside import ATP-binding protein MglA n=1 Tax=Caproicibacter fermentans TaxID=2576756 RepID=A0A6N8I187_9FIRM|nr:ATP-binding cassette domain-containing protein [Caproicibacter fermentans]MVB11510.1 Galactose/methyl galactoside import ATP-binding protein MglA [Caproicibacter fermentans]OCN02707.1 allose ABC transporter ATP-binding protein [Clostridium sp. W14A]
MEPLIKMVGITKVFPGVKALNNISLDIMPGEVHILLGENGAGKSTLMKILSGVYQPTLGKIIIGGKEYKSLTTKDSYDEGVAIIYQELSVINELSILENLFVGKLPTVKKCGISVVDYKTMEEKAAAMLQKVGVHRPLKTFVEDLTMPEKQQVEIAKALVSDAKIIIMDEPTTSLTTAETDNLFALIRKLKSENKGIVYISHKMDEIKKIGDRVTVLKDGTYVGTRRVDEVTVDELVTMMVGREIKGTYFGNPDVDLTKQPILFEAKNITRSDGRCRNISFQLHKGEILGFAGLVGAGRTETMEAIFGAHPKIKGQVFLNGRELHITSPYSAIKQGLGMVTENRRETGIIDNFNVKQNISMVPYLKQSSAGGIGGFLDGRQEVRWAEEQKANLHIKCTGINQMVVDLSGGNQQKVILGKWLAANTEVIIFDEPTKGIDIGSKSEIYQLMRKLANEGKGVLMISSELTELLSVCDRIAVFREGEIRMIFNSAEASEEKIVKTSTGEY